MNLIFDLDGTLLQSAPGIHAAVALTLAAFGQDPLDLPQVTSFIGNGTTRLIQQVLTATGQDQAQFEAYHQAFLDHYAVEMLGGSPAFPGVEVALRQLQDAGAKLGICTNKPQALAVEILQSVGLAAYFDVILGGDSLPQRKPAPEPLWETARQLGGPVLYIGDSEVDAETATAAGIGFVLFTKGYRKASIAALPHLAHFDDYRALPPLIAALSRQISAA